MNTVNKFIAPMLLSAFVVGSVCAQRPRAVASDTSPKEPAKTTPAPAPVPAPQSVTAKYEGGVFGYNKVQEGTLIFDDANGRLVFRNKEQREVFSIPYSSITQEFADSQKRRPKSATIAGSVPIPYGVNPIGYIKTKSHYLTLQFYDEVSHAGGITSFRIDNKDVCASIVQSLGQKAGLTQQGEIYVRPRTASVAAVTRVDPENRPAVAVENDALSDRVISLPRPVYPDEARQEKLAGVVRVLVTVDEKGNVAEAEAISGSPKLQAAAVDAARQAKFEPLLTDGRPVRTKSVISYTFVVN